MSRTTSGAARAPVGEVAPVNWRREVTAGVARSMAVAVGVPLLWSAAIRFSRGEFLLPAMLIALYIPLLIAASAALRSEVRAALTIASLAAMGFVITAAGQTVYGAMPILLSGALATLTLGTRWAAALTVIVTGLVALALALADRGVLAGYFGELPGVRIRQFTVLAGLTLGLVAAIHVVLRSLRDSLETSRRLLSELRREAADRLKLAYRVNEAEEEERRRIARELHDDVGQRLTALKMQLEMLAPDAPRALRPGIDEAVALAGGVLDDTRSLSRDLRPALLDEAGLVPAIGALLESQARAAGFSASVDAEPGLRLTHGVEIATYRVLQEAIANIVQHARARHVHFSAGASGQTLEMTLSDDGVGFDVPDTRASAASDGHIGLLSMWERLAMVGGECRVESAPGLGTTIRLAIPRSPLMAPSPAPQPAMAV